MTIDPFHVRKLSEWSDADFDLDDLVLPEQQQWHRCGAVHCIDRGPWLGTLVCCIRRSGHEDAHSMSLGDEGAPDYWRDHLVLISGPIGFGPRGAGEHERLIRTHPTGERPALTEAVAGHHHLQVSEVPSVRGARVHRELDAPVGEVDQHDLTRRPAC